VLAIREMDVDLCKQICAQYDALSLACLVWESSEDDDSCGHAC
jgi:hypothetical protein